MVDDKIIALLREQDGYISGEEISKFLNLTRAGVWKHIQEMRAVGYDIVAVPHLGYQLISVPDKLLPGEIRYGLKTRYIGRDIIYHETTTSTMDEAFALGLERAAEGTVVIAENQNKGRGRMGRSWASPKGKGIYCSVLLRPRLGLSEVARLTLMSAVALAESIEEVSGLQARIKWPNDILIDGKKAAGILTELSAEADRVKFLVLGVGVNVNATAGQLPEGATSLREQSGRPLSRVELTRIFFTCLERWYERLQVEDFEAVAARWRELSITLNNRVRVVEGHHVLEGTALDIDRDGGLLIQTPSGRTVKKMSGDVIQVR